MPNHLRLRLLASAIAALLLCPALLVAQAVTLTGRVQRDSEPSAAKPDSSLDIVVWLAPLGDTPKDASLSPPPIHPRLLQKNKRFQPHLLAIPVRTSVEFPNQDPFFHNVFSLFEGKRFDLGLYEAGSTRFVRFDRPGISYIFCNIHPEMSAVVVALDTPYYSVATARGELVFHDVPPGRYRLNVWAESASPEDLKALEREITVNAAASSLGVIHVPRAEVARAHKNKYGQDYPPPTPPSPGYDHP